METFVRGEGWAETFVRGYGRGLTTFVKGEGDLPITAI